MIADTMIGEMSLEDRIGQVLMVPAVEHIMQRVHAGTIICLGHHIPDDTEGTRKRMADLQRMNAESSAIPLWVHGFVCEPEWSGPTDKEIAEKYTVAEAEDVSYKLGKLWRHIGFHTNPRPTVNIPVHGTCIALGWSISVDLDTTVRYARALTRGLQRARCGNMAQHFPAHGATAVDSHHDVPVIEISKEELMREHIPPYAATFAEGCTTICTAHLRCPALDPDPTSIATTSRPILVDFLRGELGYQGVTIADCVSMVAYQKMGDVTETTIDAVNAGCDSICITLEDDTSEKIFTALLGAAHDGRLSEDRLNEAVMRNLSFKKWLGILA